MFDTSDDLGPNINMSKLFTEDNESPETDMPIPEGASGKNLLYIGCARNDGISGINDGVFRDFLGDNPKVNQFNKIFALVESWVSSAEIPFQGISKPTQMVSYQKTTDLKHVKNDGFIGNQGSKLFQNVFAALNASSHPNYRWLTYEYLVGRLTSVTGIKFQQYNVNNFNLNTPLFT